MADRKTQIKSKKISFKTFQRKRDVSGIDGGRCGVKEIFFIMDILAQVFQETEPEFKIKTLFFICEQQAQESEGKKKGK